MALDRGQLIADTLAIFGSVTGGAVKVFINATRVLSDDQLRNGLQQAAARARRRVVPADVFEALSLEPGVATRANSHVAKERAAERQQGKPALYALCCERWDNGSLCTRMAAVNGRCRLHALLARDGQAMQFPQHAACTPDSRDAQPIAHAIPTMEVGS